MDSFQQNFDQNISTTSSGGFSAGFSGGAYQYGAPRSSVTTIISIAMLVISLGMTGGAWFWNYQARADLASAQEELAIASKAYNPGDLKALTDVRDELARAKDLVSGHPVPSTLIGFLGDNTEATVYWSDFSYHRGGSDAKGGGDTLSLNGSAQGYNGLIQQMDQFRHVATNVVSKADLGSYSFDPKTGLVNFSISLSINPQYVLFPQVVSRGESEAPAVTGFSTTTAPTIVTPPTIIATTTVPVKSPPPVSSPATTTPPVPAATKATTTSTSTKLTP